MRALLERRHVDERRQADRQPVLGRGVLAAVDLLGGDLSLDRPADLLEQQRTPRFLHRGERSGLLSPQSGNLHPRAWLPRRRGRGTRGDSDVVRLRSGDEVLLDLLLAGSSSQKRRTLPPFCKSAIGQALPALSTTRSDGRQIRVRRPPSVQAWGLSPSVGCPLELARWALLVR